MLTMRGRGTVGGTARGSRQILWAQDMVCVAVHISTLASDHAVPLPHAAPDCAPPQTAVTPPKHTPLIAFIN
jgi:hypothetical protein